MTDRQIDIQTDRPTDRQTDRPTDRPTVRPTDRQTDVFRLLFGYRRSCSASEMFVNNNMYTFEGRRRKHIDDFIMWIGSSSNILIAMLRENSFILAGPLGQKLVRGIYTIYN